MKKVVMTFGTFDWFHPGHTYYLSEAKKLGEYLITIVARDINVEKIKAKKPKYPEDQRLQEVQESAIADEILLGSIENPYQIILERKPDILCFGYDQQSFNGKELDRFLNKHWLHPQIITLSAFEPEKWKSSKLR